MLDSAMSTPMAVSYPNIFMPEFKQHLSLDFEQRYKCKPALYLRFIENICLV